ncbi:MAG: hypothetical protein ACRDL7_15275 [Gaiellaceae bacterium]
MLAAAAMLSPEATTMTGGAGVDVAVGVPCCPGCVTGGPDAPDPPPPPPHACHIKAATVHRATTTTLLRTRASGNIIDL